MIFGLFFYLQTQCQDFKFKGQCRSTLIEHFKLGEKKAFESKEENKKVNIQFDGRVLTTGKSDHKYIWHQNSRDMEVIQLNCIERVEDGRYPYIDAKFEIKFVDSKHIELIKFVSTSPTTEKRITYFIEIKKTTK